MSSSQRTDDRAILAKTDEIVARCGRGREAAIPILQALQAEFRHLPREALERVCELTEITPAQLTGVSTFYSQFRHHGAGKHLIYVCHGTACHVAGAPLITAAFSEELGVDVGKTSKDGLFTLEAVSCVGACALAPVVRVGESETLGRMTPDKARKVVVDLRRQEGAE